MCVIYLAWENSRHFATLPLVSPPNDIWETNAEIPYWWRVTAQIWVVSLIGCTAREICFKPIRSIACEQQTHFRSLLLSLRKIASAKRGDDRKCVCCSQAVRSTTHIWAMTRDQYGISAVAFQTSFRGDTSGGVAKWRLSSQATFTKSLIRKSSYATKNITLNWLHSHYLTITYCIDLVYSSHHPRKGYSFQPFKSLSGNKTRLFLCKIGYY